MEPGQVTKSERLALSELFLCHLDQLDKLDDALIVEPCVRQIQMDQTLVLKDERLDEAEDVLLSHLFQVASLHWLLLLRWLLILGILTACLLLGSLGLRVFNLVRAS